MAYTCKAETIAIPTSLICMKKANKICVLTNRLTYFSLENKHIHSKGAQILPFMCFDTSSHELLLGFHNNVRLFNIKYGVLSKYYDRDMYNLPDEIGYIRHSKDSRRIIIGGTEGSLKEL